MVNPIDHSTNAQARYKYAQVAEDTCHAICRSGSALCCLISGSNTDKSLRAIDEESCHSQHDDKCRHRCRCGQEIEYTHKYGCSQHTEYASAVSAALEPLVCSPTCNQHTYDTENLKRSNRPSCIRERQTASLLQELRAPIQHRKTYHIDKEVGKRQSPDYGVAEHLLAQECTILCR